MGNIIVLDTETTGLPFESRARVIEVGAVAISTDGNTLGEFSSIVNAPIGPWATKALSICKIPERVIAAAPRAEKTWVAFLEWMSLYAPLSYVTAYNIRFDKELMARTFPDSVYLPWANCVMEMAAGKLVNRKQLALHKAQSMLNLEVTQDLHRALYDAKVAAAVMVALND